MEYNLALIAQNLRNSATPIMIETLMEDLGISYRFEILDVAPDDLECTIETARNERNGLIVTMPHKQAAMQYMDELDESAVKCGSCNVVQVNNGRLKGYNTDGIGLVAALAHFGHNISGAHVVMVGAGGVASSITYNLARQGASRVDVLNIIPEQAKSLCGQYPDLLFPHELNDAKLEHCCLGADLFINASILGQVGYDDYQNLSFLKQLNPKAVVYDVNYHNTESKLIPAAADAGLYAYNGKSMNACQGPEIIEIFTGQRPSRDGLEKLMKIAEIIPKEKSKVAI